jgi:hypothetical protein
MMLGGLAGLAGVMFSGGVGPCGRNSPLDILLFFGGLLAFLAGLLAVISSAISIAIKKLQSSKS